MADRGDDTESTGEDSAAASSIDGPALSEAMDPMGLGGVGGGWFGGDPAGSGGGTITGNPNTTAQQDATISRNIKSFMSKHNIKDLDFWDIARKGVIEGRFGLEALGIEFDPKYGLITSKSLVSFFSKKTEDETEEEAKERAAKELDSLFSSILDKHQDLSPQEKSALADILANEVTDAWQGTEKGLFGWDIASRINPMVKDAIEAWKDKNNVPQSNIPSIYDKSKKSELFQKQLDEKRDKVAKISNYLDIQQVASVAPPPTVVDDPTTIESLQAYEDNPPPSTQEVFDDIENMLDQRKGPTIQQAPPPIGQNPVDQNPVGMLSQTTAAQPHGLISTAQNVNVPTNTTADLVGLNLSYDFNTDPTFGAHITA
tara:strand:- start:914 stop:2029 length:1116 start_codon:yes stop_codon:yes gene_type:complete